MSNLYLSAPLYLSAALYLSDLYSVSLLFVIIVLLYIPLLAYFRGRISVSPSGASGFVAVQYGITIIGAYLLYRHPHWLSTHHVL